MTNVVLSRHAETRMAQRGIAFSDIGAVLEIATEVDDGFIVLRRDYQEFEHNMKQILPYRIIRIL